MRRDRDEKSRSTLIRGISEANTEGLNLSREVNSEPSHHHIDEPSKRKRMVENQQEVKVIDENPSEKQEFENNDDIHSFDTHKEKIMKTYDEFSTQNTVLKNTDKRFHCEKCDKNFSCQSAFNRHNKSSHDGVKYPCTECNYKATQKASLQVHVAAVHEGVKYPCTDCNYKATTNQSLQKQY